MGYEVIYYYKEKLDGEFSGEVKNFKKRVGDPYEDFPLEKLAAVISSQLARRDIYVKDVEIYEITKKKIKFKETKNGIILKNRKYSFDENFEPTFSCEISEENEEQTQPKVIQNKEPSQNKQPEKTQVNLDRVIKRMTFVPEPQQQIDLLKRGIKLTPDKNYNVYKVEAHMNGVNEIYTIIDDRNNQQQVSDLCFVPISNLYQEDEKEPGLSNDGLSWHGVISDNIPSVRK
jgi:hypothetical protein